MSRYQTSGTKSTIPELNAELEKIAVSQEDFLSRVGQAPNQMEGNLDMNSHRILNLPAPINPTDLVRLADLVTTPDVSVTLDAVYASSFGVLSDGGDYTTELQAMFDSGDETTTFVIDSTHYALSDSLLINNGFKEVIHYPNCVVDWLGAGLLSTTAKALYSINLDANGSRTNETVLTDIAVEALEGDGTFTVTSSAGLEAGDVIRIDKHICRVVRIDGNDVITDRTLPIPSMPVTSEVSRLEKPNIGSVFQGPTLIKFAPDNVTQVYGFGVIAALCYNVTVKRMYGLHNASRLAELFYCADSTLEDVYQYEPTDVSGGGQSYAARISNGNDNLAQKIRSYKGRHCVDITFSHRNFVRDSVDYQGVEASFLTHFNGCRYNKFINCNMYECLFGVYLSADNGDFENEWTDSFSFNSRAIYRPVETSYFRRLKIVTTDSARDVVVPRGAALPSTLNAYDCHFDLVSDFINVDSDYTVNMYGGSYKSTRIDGLFRGIATGTAGAPSTTGEGKFNFYGVQFPDISIGQGRSNLNVDILFKDCTIKYSSQPFGEDCGSQRYVNCDITCTNPSPTYLVTVGSGNSCELVDCTLRDVQLPFRYFATYPATGTITFGGNKLLGTSTYDVINLLSNMSWTTSGYTTLPLLRTVNGTPLDGTEVHIDTENTADPIKRKRVAGVWVDFYPAAGSLTTTELINSVLTGVVGTVIESSGYYTSGDGGAAKWKSTGNVITASQSPIQTANGTFSDADGKEFSLVTGNEINVKSLGLKGDNVAEDAAINSFITYWMQQSVAAYVPAGSYRATGRILFPVLLNPDRRMPTLRGDGAYSSMFVTSSAVSPSIHFYGSAAGPDHFQGKLERIGFITDIPDVGIAIGLSDYSDNFGNFTFDQVFFSNANSTSNAAATSLQLNWLFDCTFSNVVVTGKPNFGTALQCRKTVFCDFSGGSYSNAYYGIKFDGNGSLSCTFSSYDIENTTIGIFSSDATTDGMHFLNGFIDIRDPIGGIEPAGGYMFDIQNASDRGFTFDSVEPARSYSEPYTGSGFSPSTLFSKVHLRGRFTGQTTPAMLASDAATTNNTGQTQRVTIWGGTVTEIFVNGVSRTLTGGEFTLNSGEFIAIRYSAAPSWEWDAVL